VELALRALRIEAGAEVALAGYDFSGNFRAVEAVGARPVLVDIEPHTWCLDMESLAAAVGPETKAVIVSHLHGGLADMRAITTFSRKRGIAVVEDACQTPGGHVQGRMAGAWGDVGVLSFGGSKLLTAGRGGAIVTNDPHVAQRAKIYCERGNQTFPLSELQAAVLLPQLAKLAGQNSVRQARANELRAATRHLGWLAPVAAPDERGAASYYKFAWLLSDSSKLSREQLIQAIQAEGIALDAGFRGFTGRTSARCRKASELPHARHAASHTVLLHHPVLLEGAEAIARIAKALERTTA
jgi:dTDP-4-amino-4,6-dideoxygalactose transaminase